MQHTQYFQTLALYNRWMNEKLYAVCGAMPDAMRKQDRGAPFKSISGTFNHLLLADRVWLGRFKNQPFQARSLDQQLYADFEELGDERKVTDEEISDWVSSLTDEVLRAPFSYTTFVNPAQHTQPLWQCALHFFNHQTHHRGQLTVLIEQAGFDCGVTDLLRMPFPD